MNRFYRLREDWIKINLELYSLDEWLCQQGANFITQKFSIQNFISVYGNDSLVILKESPDEYEKLNCKIQTMAAFSLNRRFNEKNLIFLSVFSGSIGDKIKRDTSACKQGWGEKCKHIRNVKNTKKCVSNVTWTMMIWYVTM